MLDLKPPTSHSEAEAMLSISTDWFEVQGEANATQVLLFRKIRNMATQKARASKKKKKQKKITDYFIWYFLVLYYFCYYYIL